MSGNHSTTGSDSPGAGSVTPPGRDRFDAWFDTPAATTVRQLEAAHALAAEILGAFSSASGDWYLAGVSREQHAEWRQRAGLEVHA